MRLLRLPETTWGTPASRGWQTGILRGATCSPGRPPPRTKGQHWAGQAPQSRLKAPDETLKRVEGPHLLPEGKT